MPRSKLVNPRWGFEPFLFTGMLTRYFDFHAKHDMSTTTTNCHIYYSIHAKQVYHASTIQPPSTRYCLFSIPSYYFFWEREPCLCLYLNPPSDPYWLFKDFSVIFLLQTPCSLTFLVFPLFLKLFNLFFIYQFSK